MTNKLVLAVQDLHHMPLVQDFLTMAPFLALQDLLPFRIHHEH
jgi:hypothetical protein